MINKKKVVFDLQIDGKKQTKDGEAIAKEVLPYGCIKRK